MTIEIIDQCIQLGIAIISKMMDQWIQLGTDIISKMNPGERIQLGIAVILAVTLSLIFRQVQVQKKLLKAQLRHDLFEMYLRLYDTVTEDQIKELHLCHKIYMDDETYNEYKLGDQAIRKYIFMSRRYECLAFIHAISVEYPFIQFRLWKKWTRDLCEEKEFLDVHKNYSLCYDKYAKSVVKEIQNAKQLGQDQSKAKVQGNTEPKSTA